MTFNQLLIILATCCSTLGIVFILYTGAGLHSHVLSAVHYVRLHRFDLLDGGLLSLYIAVFIVTLITFTKKCKTIKAELLKKNADVKIEKSKSVLFINSQLEFEIGLMIFISSFLFCRSAFPLEFNITHDWEEELPNEFVRSPFSYLTAIFFILTLLSYLTPIVLWGTSKFIRWKNSGIIPQNNQIGAIDFWSNLTITVGIFLSLVGLLLLLSRLPSFY